MIVNTQSYQYSVFFYVYGRWNLLVQVGDELEGVKDHSSTANRLQTIHWFEFGKPPRSEFDGGTGWPNHGYRLLHLPKLLSNLLLETRTKEKLAKSGLPIWISSTQSFLYSLFPSCDNHRTFRWLIYLWPVVLLSLFFSFVQVIQNMAMLPCLHRIDLCYIPHLPVSYYHSVSRLSCVTYFKPLPTGTKHNQIEEKHHVHDASARSQMSNGAFLLSSAAQGPYE